MLTVRTFARYRILLGFDDLQWPLPSPPTLRTLLAEPRFQRLPKEALFAVNQRLADLDQPLNDQDEVAFLPPVSGG